MNLNGVARFLSRRDKNRDKSNRSKVRTASFPPPPSSPAVCSTDGSASPGLAAYTRRRANSLSALYHRLPSLPSLSHSHGGDGSLLVQPRASSPLLSSLHVHTSTAQCSDYLTLQSSSNDEYAIFSMPPKGLSKSDEEKVKTLASRLEMAGFTTLAEPQIHYALTMTADLEEAYELLLLANDAFEGVLVEYDPNVRMKGAVNRKAVTCYLDALLFAMFARLDSFEGMLFNQFTDEPRKKLATIIRLWINLLRSGVLIGVDFMEHLQEALAECGWEEAAEVRQQDVSEAFTFITGVLELPLLTLKMDIYHTGREDKEDDHKFVNERLLEVAIPDHEGDKVITLEECLESYFNNRIEVKRYLQRQNTTGSMRGGTDKDFEKAHALHVETVEVSGAESPSVSTPTSLHPGTPSTPARPTEGRRRADSIFSERYRTNTARTDEMKAFDEKQHLEEMWMNGGNRPRSTSLRKEVLMPAWQFFSLIPWYTDSVPKSDAQVAAHFSAQRPMLGICLKRYMVMPDGRSKRLGTYIDIPLEIGLPHFVSDDRIDETGPLFGNFKLVLQSVVCHRGETIHSGHYVALIRASKPPDARPSTAQSEAEYTPDSWLLFDDLAEDRVVEVNIKEALRTESPYLLFFQVQPIDEELASRGDPPAYAETSSTQGQKDAREDSTDTVIAETDMAEWEKVTRHLQGSSSTQPAASRSSMSSNHPGSLMNEVDGSVDSLVRGRAEPPTPLEDKSGFLAVGSRRGSKTANGNKSRPSSQNGEGRLSLALSRLSGRGSKDKLHVIDSAMNSDEPIVVINSGTTIDSEAVDDTVGVGTVKEKMSVLGRSKSRRDKGKSKEKKTLRSKSKDPAAANGDKARPDRECSVM
ncbi:cysteine proteinase [Sporormia fimetaria CBS 119925]|uniref:ubiquitinyl hydrolase 1 n=1 Tax=Sporormia fimetaria CBS 119925 TaxID=1340428 RepID=A0A6A6VKE2_9PLEO|nr:cysteine proteinase [Sporormia fimetaria CBS 119925]